ncbi:regulatory protein RecX [Protaetiibacter sp. SSC-01]|uniref:regulatory protein RecX n=1 Tax=Protaetiibacter sp. SSC-01 TaxID=2759943 RepID=UPI001656A360|nr:regulatory protein RecX [Protaetiibacter sp. SSC-01]QNO36601.1 regulatory protein RecX [Protaetiibacter sp. SSC-01]
MEETDGRLAPVSYLFGPRSSVSSAPASVPQPRAFDDDDDTGEVYEPEWNDAWGSDVDDACARLSDAERDVALDAGKISLKALTRRDLSRRELERVLRDADIDDESVERECDRLARVGLIDDAALAQKLVATLQERKGLGRTAIAAELTRRMLAPSAIEYALELVDTGDELARARELARKRAGQLRDLDRDAAVRRLSSYLARRGYSGSTVRAAVDEALASRPSGSVVRFR